MQVSDLPKAEMISLCILSEMQDMLPDNRKPLLKDVQKAIQGTLFAISNGPWNSLPSLRALAPAPPPFAENEPDISSLSVEERDPDQAGGGEDAILETQLEDASLPAVAPPPPPSPPSSTAANEKPAAACDPGRSLLGELAAELRGVSETSESGV